VEQLRHSVFALLERMLPTEALATPAADAQVFTVSV
jgi:hypothetical protein